jgi:protein-S-isoprenylcysteine O-methyltransferase Ste14
MIPILASLIRIFWALIEYPYVRRFQVPPEKDWDKHSAKLWDIANLIEPVGMIAGFSGVLRIQSDAELIKILGLLVLLSGIGLRWTAIHTLGKFFTGRVVIKKDHHLGRRGVYRYLRHPAYTGALIAHLGLGLSFANWLSLLLSVLPYVVAALYRVRVEEQALTEAFGEDYLVYAKETKRLIPGVY